MKYDIDAKGADPSVLPRLEAALVESRQYAADEAVRAVIRSSGGWSVGRYYSHDRQARDRFWRTLSESVGPGGSYMIDVARTRP
jgi:hypothetical protein